MSKKEFRTYDPPVLYPEMRSIKDVYVPMRDGVQLCVSIYLPVGEGPFPALLSFGMHNKDLLDADYSASMPPQPSWSHFWFGNIESGDSKFFCSRGYAHVCAQARGSGKSGPGNPMAPSMDQYDVIEWMAQQDWCDGNIGMMGLSNFGANQLAAANQHPPHLKAIFPQDPGFCYGMFREMHPGGVLSTLMYHLEHMDFVHMTKGQPPELPEPQESMWKTALANPDYQMYKNLYNALTQKGQAYVMPFMNMLFPFEMPGTPEAPGAWETGKGRAADIDIPVYTGSGQYAIDYHFHWLGAQHWFTELKGNKKLSLGGPAHQERPFHSKDLHNEALKWYDYWLKGIDTGVMDEPAVRYWVTGENKWRYAESYPIPETQWTPFYLDSWERLHTGAIDPYSWDGAKEPDAFVQSPPTLTNHIAKLRYMTEPLAEDTLVAGPMSMNFWASIDSDDTNWIVTLKDLGPDSSDRTGRKGEREIGDLPEKYLTKGFLKASMRKVDPDKSTPYEPWNVLTPDGKEPVVPGEINEYHVAVMAVNHMFKAGHRICVDISCLDLPDGACCVADTEYIPYHICRNATVCHKIYRDGEHPSHILLPIVPTK